MKGNNVQAVRDILTKNRNEDGSFGRGNDLPDETGVEGVTRGEVDAAAELLGQSGAVEDDHEDGQVFDEDAGDGGQVDEGSEGGEATDVTVTTAELAKAIGWEESDVYEGIMVPLGGNEEPVTLSQLKNKYQDARTKVNELESQIKKSEESRQGAEQQPDLGRVSQGMMQLAGYMQQLDQIESTTDWADLEATDPSTAVLKRQKLWQARQQTAQKMQQLGEHEKRIMGQQIAKEKEKMLSFVPDWKDDAKRKTDQSEIKQYLHDKYGLEESKVTSVKDAVTMAILHENLAMRRRLDEIDKATKDATKRVRQAPRVLRGGDGRFVSPDGGEDAVINKLTARAKRTGNRHDQMDAARAILTKSQRGQRRSLDGRTRPRRQQ